jgi:hypothetical protein
MISSQATNLVAIWRGLPTKNLGETPKMKWDDAEACVGIQGEHMNMCDQFSLILMPTFGDMPKNIQTELCWVKRS